MFPWFKNYFIPSEQNNYKPRILRKEATIFILGIVLLLEIFFLLQTLLIFQKTNLLATVFPNVVADLTNKNRQINNLKPLQVSPLLELAAQQKAEDMAKNGYFAHTSPDGKNPWYWFKKVGYNYRSAGENLAIHFFDSQDLVNAWLESSSHRANILNRNFTETGIGIARGFYGGKETVYIVQLFGQPAGVSKTAAGPSVATQKPETKPKEVAKEEIPEMQKEPPPQEMFIEKEDEAAPLSSEVAAAEQLKETAGAEKVSSQSSLPERIISSPRITTSNLYLLISIIMAGALLLNIFINIRVQYPTLILSGLFIIISMALVFFLNKYIILSQAQIF